MSSMRFAISMLSIVGLASIIGTVLKQNQSYESYIIKFGQFWFEFFVDFDYGLRLFESIARLGVYYQKIIN